MYAKKPKKHFGAHFEYICIILRHLTKNVLLPDCSNLSSENVFLLNKNSKFRKKLAGSFWKVYINECAIIGTIGPSERVDKLIRLSSPS